MPHAGAKPAAPLIAADWGTAPFRACLVENAAISAQVTDVPGEAVTPAVVKALRAVPPREARLVPVGEVSAATMAAYAAAGADGFGSGSALYKPGDSAGETRMKARELIAAWRALPGLNTR